MSKFGALFITLTLATSANAALSDRAQTSGHTPEECKSVAFRAGLISPDVVVPSIAIADLDLLRIDTVTQFEAPCASWIRAAKMDLVQLKDGTVLEPSSSRGFAYRISDSLAFDDAYDLRDGAERKLPKNRGEPLLDSVRVNAKMKGGDFVGIWNIDGRWLIQAFSQKPDGGYMKPRLILTSSLPVRSVQYFPAPDSPSGSLFVVQEQPAGRARAIRFTWFHRQAYVEKRR